MQLAGKSRPLAPTGGGGYPTWRVSFQNGGSRLEDAYAWLNENLAVPPFKQLPNDVASWFRDEAGEPLQRMWEIASLLKECGIPVRMLRSTNPGKVVYEDEYQVVVEEWQAL